VARAGRILRWILGGIAIVVLFVALVLALLPVWVRTRPGHREVDRILTRLLNERVPGTVTTGRLSGSVVGGLHAEHVVVRNPSGELIGRAERLSARWRPLALIFDRELDEVIAQKPAVALDRARWRVPPSRGKRGRSTTIDQLIANDGSLVVRGKRFDHLDGRATLRSRTNLDVHALSARFGSIEVDARGVVGWGERRRGWVAARFAARDPGRASAAGDFFYTPDQLEGALDELTIAAPVATRLVGGSGPLHLQGEVGGAPDQLTATASAHQRGRALRLRATIDAPRREVVFDATLAGGPHPIRVHARARDLDGTLSVPSLRASIGQTRLRASGRLARKVVHAKLAVRLFPREARWLALTTHAPLIADLALDGPLAAVAISARARLARARLTLRGRGYLTAHRARAELVVSDLDPAALDSHAPEMAISSQLSVDGRLIHHALVAEVQARRGRASIRGRTLEALSGEGSVRLARQGEIQIRRLSGRWSSPRGPLPIAARGLLRYRPGRIAFSDGTVELAGSRASGSALWQRGDGVRPRLTAHADKLVLSPALLARAHLGRPRQAWVGRAALDGTPQDFIFQLDAATELGPLSAVARVIRRSKDDRALEGVQAKLGASMLAGAVELRHGRLTGSIERLALAPALIRQLEPSLDPSGPIALSASADGPLEAIDLRIHLDAGATTAELAGQLSARSRRFEATGHLDNFDLAVLDRKRTRVRATLDLAAEGRQADGGMIGSVTIRNARGFMMTSPFYRGFADARLHGRKFDLTRAHVEIPGAKIAASGTGVLGREIHIGYGVVITNAFALRHVPAALRLVIGLNGILPGRTIEGRLEKTPGKKLVLTHHVLPIGASQLVFLYRVLSGKVPVIDHRRRR
jgi:hypothetical protein